MVATQTIDAEAKLSAQIAELPKKSKVQLLELWKEVFPTSPPGTLRKELMFSILAYRMQQKEFGGLSHNARKRLKDIAKALLLIGHGQRQPDRQPERGLVSSGSGMARSTRSSPPPMAIPTVANRIYRGEITHKGNSYPGQHPAIVGQKLWNQVQAQFKANLHAERTRPRSSHQNLLVGLLYDAEGNRFTPSHANKKGRRYSYYVSQAAIQNKAQGKTGPVRIPAEDIEDLVTAQVTHLLRSPQRIMNLLHDPALGTESTRQLLEAIVLSTDKVENLVVSVTLRIVLHNDRVEIQIDRNALRRYLLGLDASSEDAEPNGEFLTLEANAMLKRYGGEVRFQLGPDTPGSGPYPFLPSCTRSHERTTGSNASCAASLELSAVCLEHFPFRYRFRIAA